MSAASRMIKGDSPRPRRKEEGLPSLGGLDVMPMQPTPKRRIIVTVSAKQWRLLQVGRRSARIRSLSQYVLRKALDDAQIRTSLQTTI
jgi:hypothetical protein